jgi:hypothetical protein
MNNSSQLMVPAVEWQDCIVRIDMVVAVMDSPDFMLMGGLI